MFCKNCGMQILEGASICTNCGTLAKTSDEGGFLWGLLGCCIPLVGLILFLVWKDTKPKTSKAAGIGALVSTGLSILFVILYYILVVGILVSIGTAAY